MRAANGEDFDIENDYNFLMFCNDFTVKILQTADKNKWSAQHIRIKEKDQEKFMLGKYDLIYWRNHGYARDINESLYRHMIFSLISDYNKYVYDAILCARRYHFGPAFTLLRKPFKDNLLFLEMMYINHYNFIPKFLNNSIDNFAIDKISEPEKKNILKRCCRKTGYLNDDRLYDLRYDKKSRESLEKIWNKTSHLITSYKEYATENGNLNIIFADDKIVQEHLVYFYNVCVSVQYYFLYLVLSILKDESLISDDEYLVNFNNLHFACACTFSIESINKISEPIQLRCQHCGYDNSITKEIIIENINNKTCSFVCKKCEELNSVESFQV